MNKKWYIIQLVAGYESKIKDEINRRFLEKGLSDQIGEILIPEIKKANSFFDKIESSEIEQLFPGYVIISLVPLVENFRLIMTIYRVIKFLGGATPTALSNAEIDRILSQVSGKIVVSASPDFMYNVGEAVEIIEGPFSGFSGVINFIDEHKKRMVIMISIFNRSTPIEVSFHQVKK